MAYKIYTVNNYFFLEDLIQDSKYLGFKKQVRIRPNNKGRDVYTIHNLEEWNEKTVIDLNSIQKEDGTPYTSTEWTNFYTSETGNFNSGLVLNPQIQSALNLADSPSSSNPFATESLERVVSIQSFDLSTSGQVVMSYLDQAGTVQTFTTSAISGVKNNVLNYSALLATVPQTLYEFAYVREDQGVKWLPGSLGGTYYSAGLYMWNGTSWTNDNTELAEGLQDLTIELTSKSDVGHTHLALEVTDFDTEVSNNINVSANTATRHTHTNKTVLDNTSESFTTTLKTNYDLAEVNIDELLTTGNRLITSGEIGKLSNLTGNEISRLIENRNNTVTTLGATAKTDYVQNCTGTNILTLPTAVGNTNKYTVSTISGETTVATTSSQTINGSNSITINTTYTSLDFISDGTNWIIR